MRLLLFAMGPWPGEPNARLFGPTIRARQFLEPLVEDGHTVSVALLEDTPRRSCSVPGVRRAAAFDPERLLEPRAVWKGARRPPFDAVAGVGSLMPAAAAARFGRAFSVPAWVDLFGDPFAEHHAASTATGETDHVRRDQVWKLQREALLHGDVFSVVSQPQASALLGQLLLLGRVDGPADIHRRIQRIPVAAPPAWTKGTAPRIPACLRGTRPFVAVTGTWTPWLDPVAMGEALRLFLDQAPKAHVVVRAAGDGEAGAKVREAFDGALGESERVHRVGADECDEDALLAHAAAVLMLDKDLPESRLGARNRLLAAARWGTEVVATPWSETAREMAAADVACIALTPEDAGRELVRAANAPAKSRTPRRKRGRAWLATQTYKETLRPVLEWLKSPSPWPGAEAPGNLQGRWAAFPEDELFR